MTLRSWSGTGRTKRRACCFVLPVPIGSTVWRVRQNPACHYGVREAEKFLFGRVVTPRRIVEPVPFTLLLLDEWGRTVFLTKHEADKMLGKEEDTE